jgi:hypothetical protein
MADPKAKGLALMASLMKGKKAPEDESEDPDMAVPEEEESEDGEDWSGVASEMLEAIKAEDSAALASVLENFASACKNM